MVGKKKEIKYIVGGFIGGLLAAVILMIAGYFLKKNFQFKLSNSSIEAPYYEKKVFQPPKELVREATKSAELKIKLPIIMYHYVEYVKDAGDLIRKKLNITPYLFNEQLSELHNAGYKTYFVREIPDILDLKIDYATRSAVLTFDDGYGDFYTDVFPILKKYQMKATIYIINHYIGRKGFLTEKEIKELISSGLVEIGAHTLDHFYLKQAPITVTRRQIFESKELLEERFGVEVKTFAYPYGAFSPETVELVKEAGFTAVVSVIPGVYQSKENLFYLSRIRPGIFTLQNMIKVLESYNK